MNKQVLSTMQVLAEAQAMFESEKVGTMLKSRMYKMAEKREVPSYKPNGKNVFFAREELNDWVRSTRVSSTEEIERQAEMAANAYMLNRKSS